MARSTRRASSSGQSISGAASAGPTRLPAPRYSSPARQRALSPAAICWSMAATRQSEAAPSRFEQIEHRAAAIEGGGQQFAAAPGTGIERGPELALDEPALSAVETAHDPVKPGKRRGKLDDVLAAPPKRIALPRHWA